MGLWRGIKDKFKIVVGAVRIAVFGDVDGWGENHWDTEIRGYEENVLINPEVLDHAVFVGDTGKDGPQRDMIVGKIKEYSPKFVYLLGDVGYPIGVINEAGYKKNILKPFGNFGYLHKATYVVDGNHDAYGSSQERKFLARRVMRKSEKITRPNFYWAESFANALVVAFDSTVYDVIVGDPEIQERQEAFVHRALRDVRFQGLYKIVVCHAGVFSNGAHGRTNSGAYDDFFARSIQGQADAMIAGHDHVVNEYGTVKGTRIFTTGAGSKLTSSKRLKALPGFLTMDYGIFSVRTFAGLNIEEDKT